MTELRDLFKDNSLIKIATDDLSADLSGRISTGLPALDVALGGGIFLGRIYEIYGPKSNGKSTLTYAMAAAFQAENPNNILHIIETESAIDKVRCSEIGMDLNRIVVTETNILEEGYENIIKVNDVIEKEYGNKAHVMHIWDTISSASPKTEIEGSEFAQGMMLAPRLNKQFLKKITLKLAKTGNMLFLLQQVIQGSGYTDPQYVTTGGEAIKHHTSVSLQVKKGTMAMEGDYPIGHDVLVKVKKCKVAPPTNDILLKLNYERGFLKLESLIAQIPAGKCSPGVTVGGGGNYYLNYPSFLIEEFPELKDKNIHARGFDKLVDTVRGNELLQKMLEYYLYDNYCSHYQLMRTRYTTIFDNLKSSIKELYLKSLEPKPVIEDTTNIQNEVKT